jgi:hypothetical protein
MSVRGGKRYAIIADVCAFANTNGGTLYVGLSADPRKPVAGVPDPEQSVVQLEKEISNRISPPLQCSLDIHETGGKKVIRILIPRGEEPPYAVDEHKIYVRSEAETGLAVRDEIVEMVSRGTPQPAAQTEAAAVSAGSGTNGAKESVAVVEESQAPPRTGVEVVSVDERNGVNYYTVRDLRNNNVVKNVTRKSARRLWHYAITSYANLPEDVSKAVSQWQGDLGLLGRQKQGKSVRYDLVQRTSEGYRYYFGVTEDGIHGHWKSLVGVEDE